MSDTTKPPEPRLDPLAIGLYAKLQDMTGARNDLWRENVKLRADLEAAKERGDRQAEWADRYRVERDELTAWKESAMRVLVEHHDALQRHVDRIRKALGHDPKDPPT